MYLPGRFLLRELSERLAIRPVADNIEGKTVPLPAAAGKERDHNVITLLVAQAPECDEVDGVFVDGKRRRLLRLLPADFGNIDVVRYDPILRIPAAGQTPEGLLQGRRAGHKAVETAELVPEEVPEHPVFPLVFEFDLHIVVDPHDTLFCADAQRACRTGELVAVEVRRQVVFAVYAPVRAPEFFRRLKRQEAADPRRTIQDMDRQFRRKAAVIEAAFLKQEKLRIHAAVVQIPQKVEQTLLDTAGSEIFLKKGNSFLTHRTPRYL